MCVLAGIGLVCGVQEVEGGAILREVYTGIAGVSVSDLTGAPGYPDEPDATELITDYFESPTDVMDEYGQRLHGFVVPPVSGDYTFWIASDDGGELWLSGSEDPGGAQRIATVMGWTSSREWGREANQQSAPVSLVAGRAYYIAALMKEGGGGDNLAVRWLRPDGVDEGPIPASVVLPWGTAFEPPVITAEPSDATVVEGQTAVFEVGISAATPAVTQWQRNGQDLPGATSPTLDYGPVTQADQGALFRAVLSNTLGTVVSRQAVLSINSDVTRPLLDSAQNLGRTTLHVSFSEAVAEPGALDASNYALDGGVAVLAAAWGDDARTVRLTTSAMTFGTEYTLTVSDIADRAAIPNVILPGSSLSFLAVEYAPRDVGDPTLAGGSAAVPGGFDVTGSGAQIGDGKDQFQFSYREVDGDFDLAARVSGVTISDAFVQAGLMVRETLDADSRFAAVFASSVQIGCYFESRSAVGASAATATLRGGYPVNYPDTWLRVRRVGNTFFGFAGQDGTTWTQLGSATLSGMPQTLYFGFAVSSVDAAAAATASFRDVGPPAGTSASAPLRLPEPPGPASRRTGLAISEVMYHPPDRDDGRNLEFLEIYNGRSVAEDLSGWRLSGDIGFVFPDGYELEAGDFVVVAAVPEDIRTVYGLAQVLGPYSGALPNGGGLIQLRTGADAMRLELNYSDNPRWPVAADGAGHSLVLVRPSLGQDHPDAWSAGTAMGGSPGRADAVRRDAWSGVVINEFLAHTDLPWVDMVELYNAGVVPADLSGCWLTDDPAAAVDPDAPHRFRIPDGTVLPPRGFAAFTESELGFALRAGGDEILLIDPENTRVIDAHRFSGQENGVASGRTPDGSPTIRRLAAPTPGAPNAPRRIEDIVIHEIMYHPLSNDSDDEYVELYNRSAQAVDVSGWELGGGIEYRIPASTVISAGGYLVIGRDAARLLGTYPHLSAETVRGDYQGSLSDGGERISLRMADLVAGTNEFGEVVTSRIDITVMEVAYEDGGRWGDRADGGGSSLELIDPRADAGLAANWRASNESAKAPWTTVTATARLDHGNGAVAPDRLRLGMLGEGECLIDDIELFEPGGVNLVGNPGFEQGGAGWALQGNHSKSTIDIGAAATGSRGLHVRSHGDTDPGINSIRAPLAAGLAAGDTVTLRAKVRWLGGWPEVLFGVRGNAVEFPVRMEVPADLGTPGQANSRRMVNAGPAIFEVNHRPAVPQAGEAVTVTCRVSDPDGIGSVRLLYRIDPGATVTALALRDDGIGADALAGDGLYSAQLAGRGVGALVAFRIEAADDAAAPAAAVFPGGFPAQECLIRWGDPIPFGNFTHYHLWSTAATESARNSTPALDNTWHDATLVYNNDRVIYNVRFRDKGSPYHGGGGDFAVTVPPDDPLLGAKDRVFASTGNGGSEATGIRSQLASWLAQQLGIPYLHAQYMRLYRNGSPYRDIMEDLEQPNHDYAESWFPSNGEGDLYKVAIWFEFQDNNTTFSSIGATLQRFATVGDQLKLARYRWNFQRRSNDGMASNYANLLELVETANDTSAGFVPGWTQLVDADQWMRVFGFNRITGNWDAWSYSVGQNMFAFKQPGARWVLMPWDIDFTFGLGDGPGTGLWGGQDPILNRVYDTPTFRRMLWRCYLDAVQGPMLPERYQTQIDRRAEVLRKNGIAAATTDTVGGYIDRRRTYILNQLAAADASTFSITSNGGNDFVSTGQTVVLTGTAPFEVAKVEVNGVPYEPEWLDHHTFRVSVPLADAVNPLQLQGMDRRGRPISGAVDSVTVTYSGALQKPEDYVVIHEVNYHPLEADAEFIELYNRSTTTAFDLSGFRLDGVSYTFPVGAVIPPSGYLVLAGDRAGFSLAFGAALPVYDEFPGRLDNAGESLALVRPGGTPAEDTIISDLRYDDQAPWPVAADGLGPSLQLVDAARGAWRVANWAATTAEDPDRATPGRANAGARSLPAFPKLWLNEIQPDNVTGPTDAAGERAPWIEIHNAGSDSVDLTGLYLTDDYADLTRWAFPAGASIPGGGFLVVWADGEPTESTPSAPHTNFRLHESTGSVALVRLQGSPPAPAVLDYVDYVLLPPDRAIGAFPDGDPRHRRLLHFPTPGGPNDPTSPAIQVTLNEFMADNTMTLADPADGDYEDWIELHNAGPEPVDLTAYSLTDDFSRTDRFVIPPGYVIPAGGFLLVWADGETDQNSPTSGDLHADFRLSAGGEQLGLFAPDGTLVDGVTFAAQTADQSMGRYPDGAPPPWLMLDLPTPRQPNFLSGGNRPPVLRRIGPQETTESYLLTFQAHASDPDEGQSLTFSLDPDAPAGASIDAESGLFAWKPTETQGPGIHTVTVRVSDDGDPVRSAFERVSIQVAEFNRLPLLDPVPDQSVDEGSPLIFTLRARDPDVPANVITYSLDAEAPAGAAVDPETGVFSWTPTEDQGQGVYLLTARATDDGEPPLYHERSFWITVNEVNNPPVLPPIQTQMADELAPFTFAVQAADPDSPPSALLYSLETAPAGASIDAHTGVISWTPSESQGPGNAVFVVRATETVPPNLSASRGFSVIVAEVNQAPILGALADLTVRQGEVAVLAVSAADADLPPQALTYSLEPGAPAGALIDPAGGEFVWATHPDQGIGVYPVTVRVADNGPGGLGDSAAFSVTVEMGFHAVINEIMYHPDQTGAAYIELHNPSSQSSQSLAGLELRGNSLRFPFPAGATLAPRTFLCVAANPAAFAAAYGGAIAVDGPWIGDLNAPDTLQLVRPGEEGEPDEILDTVSFDRIAPWPLEADGQGASLQLLDANRDNDRPGNWAATTAFAGAQTLVEMTASWRYFQTGAAPANWRNPDFNDAAWPLGGALLYVESAGLPAPKVTPLTLGESTYYFRTRFTSPAPPSDASLRLTHVIDDGAVFWLNGQELHRFNMPAGAPTHGTFTSDVIGDATTQGPYVLPAGALQPGANVLAVEVHQTSLGSSDIVMGCRLEMEGSTLAAGTPGAPNTVTRAIDPFPSLRINEVMTRNTAGIPDRVGDREPWIEIVNTGPASASLQGLYLTDDPADLTAWAFPAGTTIPAGGFLLLFADGEPEESGAGELHTSFRLPTDTGAPWWVCLARLQGNIPAALDSLGGTVPDADRSAGRFPDGDPSTYEEFDAATPGTGNLGAGVPRIVDALIHTDGRPHLVWIALPGRQYRIEHKSDLGLSPWQPLGTLWPDSSQAEFTDPGANGIHRRFYRVVLMP